MPCINWTGSRTTAGYGRLRVDGRGVYAHRQSYCDANGLSLSDIEGKVVRHRCDNPACFNPDHLVIGTQADNMRDMGERGRARNVPVAGAGNNNAKLTADMVRAIRAEYVFGVPGSGCKAVASRYGIHASQVHHIVTNKQWVSHAD